MKRFGWDSPQRNPPRQWDLRRLGWHLCSGNSDGRDDCRHPLIVDARHPGASTTSELAEAGGAAWRLLVIGVDDPAERARLLTMGCAEAMSSTVGLCELDARARRIEETFGMLPRWRTIDALTLDLLHRDARFGGRWLALHPREFALLWRLADRPGEPVSRLQLLRDVWRLAHEPETNSVEVHVSRLRAKLAANGCKGLVLTNPGGGYCLATGAPSPSEPEPVALKDHLPEPVLSPRGELETHGR